VSLRSRLFRDDLGKIILNKTVSLFQNTDLRIAKHSNLVFLCGGPLEGPSSRSSFKKAFNENSELNHLQLVIAESAYTLLQEANDFRYHNASNFESLIADLSNCVLIFVESPGAIAELGYFSAFRSVSEKTLVVIDYEHQADNSFIIHGPIDRIDSHFNSRYKMRMPLKNIKKPDAEKETDFSLLFKKLKECAHFERQRALYDSRNLFKSKTKRTNSELFFLLEIINLFDVVRLKDIVNIVKAHFPSIANSKLFPLLSILRGAELISIEEDELNDTCFLRKQNYYSFFEVPYKIKNQNEYSYFHKTNKYNETKIDIKDYYGNNAPQLLRLWETHCETD
jgi:hypothetical protein